MTFNYLLSHRVMPEVFFGNLDFFYERVITNPDGMQMYMKFALEQASVFAKEHSDEIEPPFEVEEFNLGILGEKPGKGIVMVIIPNCKELNDSSLIAIPCNRKHARYFTCELSSDPLTEERYFLIGEWKPNNESFTHTNYGPIDTGESFESKLVEMVYSEQ